MCMWKWGGSAPCGQSRVSRPNWPKCAKKPCCLAVPLIKGWKIADFPKNIFFHFLTIFLVFGDFFAVFALMAIFWGLHAFWRFWQHQGDKIQLGLQGKPILWKIGRFMADMAIFQVQGPDSVMQSGASPGSSVGDTNDWILFLWFILIVFCPWFRSATSHPVQNTQNYRFFDPKHYFLTHERQKNKKIDIF